MRWDFQVGMEILQDEWERDEKRTQSSSGDSACMGAWVRTIAGGTLHEEDAEKCAQSRRCALSRYRQQRNFLDNMSDARLIKRGPPVYKFGYENDSNDFKSSD